MPILLVNWQPVLGAGTSKSVLRSQREQAAAQKLNILGNPETTRFLTLAALKEVYGEDDEFLRDATRLIGMSFQRLLTSGFKFPDGSTLYLAAISVKGDWPWLIEAAGLVRHFRKAPKKGHTTGGAGICHYCLAGMAGYPYTDCGNAPRWELTENSGAAAVPWDRVEPFTELLPTPYNLPQKLYRPDLWHNWHLGHGRYFLASAFIVILPMWDGSGVEKKFANLTKSWKSFCQLRRVKPPLAKLSKQTCGYTASLDWPEGCWQKGATTTLLCDAS